MIDLTRKRPKFLNLFAIRLPLPGFASILHRISGLGVFVVLPLLICMLDASLRSPESFAELQQNMAHPLVKLLLLGLLWAFFHHFLMGVRILLIDIHIGVDKEQARASAIAVLVGGVLLTLVAGVWLW